VNGHSNEPFFPCTVKSCSSTVESDVRLADADTLILLLAPDILLPPLAVDPAVLLLMPASLCAALRPSRITTAVCSFELVLVRPRPGSGTNPTDSGTEI
jgi:hypothetical protein